MKTTLSTGAEGTAMEFSVNTVEQARDMARRYAKAFSFASHALPPEKRHAAYALYSFWRYVDTIADEAAEVVPILALGKCAYWIAKEVSA